MSDAPASAGPTLRELTFTFSIVGVQKCGTTSLSEMLDHHRLIRKAPHKEMQFFLDDQRDWSAPDYSEYSALQRAPQQEQMGDATPEYLFWPHALERMQAYQPAMRLVAIFRDPIERLVSQWIMHRTRLGERALDWPLMMAFRPDELPREVPPGMDPWWYRQYGAVLRGRYAAQLRRGFEVFDPDQWLLLDFGAFLVDPTRHLDRVTDFLGIHRFRRYPELLHQMAQRETIAGTPPTGDQLRVLADYYGPDLEDFEQLAGIDTSHWLTRRLQRGDTDADGQAVRFARKAGLVD